MSETDIFLSYARQDRGTARIFADRLVDEGFSVWWDASLRSGETFDEVIEQNLRDAKAVIVLWSPASVASRWVRAEATLADRRNKLAPAIIEPCDRPIIFELTHAAELADWTGDVSDPRWQTFVSDLHRLTKAARDRETGNREASDRRSSDREGGPAQGNGGQPAADRPSARQQPAATEAEISSRAQPAGRQTLRPGNDEVIFADRAMRDPPVPRPLARPVVDPQAEGDAHCLEIEDGERAGELFVVGPSGAMIGRTAPADIVLSHRSISREHCLIGLATDELLVTDLNSTNGTFIDDVRISRATVLPAGSVLRLGQLALRHSVRPLAEVGICSLQGHSDSEQRLPAGRLAAAS